MELTIWTSMESFFPISSAHLRNDSIALGMVYAALLLAAANKLASFQTN